MQIEQYTNPPSPNLFRSKAWLDAWHHGWGEFFETASPPAQPVGLKPESQVEFPNQRAPIPYFSCGKLSAYAHDHKLLKIFPIRAIYPEGKSSKLIPAIRNEYFQFPFEPIDDLRHWDEFWAALDQQKWDKILFDDLLKNSADYFLLLEQAEKRGYTVLNRGEESTFGIDTSSGDFNAYLQQLSKNTKLKLYNKRSKLNSLGKVDIRNLSNNTDSFLALLNEFHLVRWGKRCFSNNNEKMVHSLLDNCAAEHVTLDCSVMTLDAKPVSAVFDIHYGNRVYNLQAGYHENLVKGISLGTLHLGYQIEAAFNNPSLDYYDLMAGRGKNANYKESLGNTKAEFVSLAVFKHKWIPAAHRLKDQLNELRLQLRGYSVKRQAIR